MADLQQHITAQDERVDAFFNEFWNTYLEVLHNKSPKTVLNCRGLVETVATFYKAYTTEADRLKTNLILGL